MERIVVFEEGGGDLVVVESIGGNLTMSRSTGGLALLLDPVALLNWSSGRGGHQ